MIICLGAYLLTLVLLLSFTSDWDTSPSLYIDELDPRLVFGVVFKEIGLGPLSGMLIILLDEYLSYSIVSSGLGDPVFILDSKIETFEHSSLRLWPFLYLRWFFLLNFLMSRAPTSTYLSFIGIDLATCICSELLLHSYWVHNFPPSLF
jgi:hypothetical protein